MAKLSKMIILMLCMTSVVSAQNKSSYAGQETREIKSLSPEEISGYLDGHGMGFAMPAELNHYPGPKHVLELAEQLRLIESQTEQTKKIFVEMKNEAVRLGKEYVEKERLLDNAFNSKAIDRQKLQMLTAEIGQLRSQLRFVHLDAHLKMADLLSQEQISQYDKLRGYGGGDQKHDHTKMHH